MEIFQETDRDRKLATFAWVLGRYQISILGLLNQVMADSSANQGGVGVSSLDGMSVNSRSFYERTLDKLMWSIFASVCCLVALGFCTWAGGLSNSASHEGEARSAFNDDLAVAQVESRESGYGFGAFMFFMAFIFYGVSAVYISPMFCGSDNEKSILRRPEELPSSQSV